MRLADNRMGRLVAGAAALVLPAAAALAAEGGEHTDQKQGVIANFLQGVGPFVVTIVVFVAVFAILSTKVWPKIVKGLQDRESKILQEIEAAELARKQAKDALDQYQKSLADARSEAQKMIETTRAEQAAFAAELKAKADVELNQMRERAMKDIEAAKRAAVSELYAHSTNLATLAASQVLRRTVTSADTQRLVEESLAQLQASAKG